MFVSRVPATEEECRSPLGWNPHPVIKPRLPWSLVWPCGGWKGWLPWTSPFALFLLPPPAGEIIVFLSPSDFLTLAASCFIPVVWKGKISSFFVWGATPNNTLLLHSGLLCCFTQESVLVRLGDRMYRRSNLGSLTAARQSAAPCDLPSPTLLLMMSVCVHTTSHPLPAERVCGVRARARHFVATYLLTCFWWLCCPQI